MSEAAPRARVLCLGNELMGDDSLGFQVAEALRHLVPVGVEVIAASQAGFNLLDNIEGTPCLVVVDTILTGTEEPGTIYEVSEQDLAGGSGSSPHGVGLFDMLELGRQLGLAVPGRVTVVAVEGSRSMEPGDPMDEAVRNAIPDVVRIVLRLV